METRKRLTELLPGDQAIISKIEFADGETVRLRDLGLNEGIPVRVVRYAPLGDPIEIKFRGFYLSMRKAIARHVLVAESEKAADEVTAR